ncbi:hypothetical protein LIER_24052 [Lithospermum erythrorhizon]|uniref:Retroviral polymerase SH3-like domain-containing protein n=1 Tax=Lithospermum erythrorhizon TaxID=34254 RepID=A0AAV3R2S1_LITER
MGNPLSWIFDTGATVHATDTLDCLVISLMSETCHRAKHTRDVFFNNFKKATRCFELIHCDLGGPYRTPSSCGAKYFLTLVDDHSRAVSVVLLSDKTELHDVFIKFIAMVKRTSTTEFWGEYVLGACYFINCTPSRILHFKLPYEILYGSPPSYDNPRVFGCLFYAFDLNSRKDKFASWSRKCIFVGYPLDKKGWKLFDLDTRGYFVSRDVTFYESEFPGLPHSLELLSESHGVFSEDDGVFFGLDECIDPYMGLDEVDEPPHRSCAGVSWSRRGCPSRVQPCFIPGGWCNIRGSSSTCRGCCSPHGGGVRTGAA